MKLLAIETSSEACSVALQNQDKVTAIHKMAPMQQGQLILSLVEEILQSQNINLNQLDALAFGSGPGSFTGVRIAASVIKGLGFAKDLPIIPISSLAALAQSAYRALGWKKMLVGIDARIQEVYWGAYHLGDHELVELDGIEIVCSPEAVVLPDGQDWYGVGNAWEIYREKIPFNPIQIDAKRLPMAEGVLELAKPKFDKQEWVTSAEALPSYVRDNVAKKSI